MPSLQPAPQCTPVKLLDVVPGIVSGKSLFIAIFWLCAPYFVHILGLFLFFCFVFSFCFLCFHPPILPCISDDDLRAKMKGGLWVEAGLPARDRGRWGRWEKEQAAGVQADGVTVFIYEQTGVQLPATALMSRRLASIPSPFLWFKFKYVSDSNSNDMKIFFYPYCYYCYLCVWSLFIRNFFIDGSFTE